MNNSDYARIEQAIQYLEQHALEQPSLEDVANQVGLSPFHFQKLFKRWAGVSPKRFLQYLTIENAKKLLRDSTSVLDTSLDVGLSGPGRLHDLFVSVEAVTPGQYKSLGQDLDLHYGFHPTPFGECLIVESEKGICSLDFIDQGNRSLALTRVKNHWPGALWIENRKAGRYTIEQIFKTDAGIDPAPVKLFLRGTNFQLKVWQALLKIPEGKVASYSSLAKKVGSPKASRAIGNAVGQNPVAFLIPCHRVLRSTGELGGYKWGTLRKKAILAMEAAHANQGSGETVSPLSVA